MKLMLTPRIKLVLLFGNVSAASVTNFFPTVVKTLGYNDVITLLLTSPPYVLAVITTFLNARHADKTGERFFHIAIPLSLAVTTFIIAAATINVPARYVAMMLMVTTDTHPNIDPFARKLTASRFRACIQDTRQPLHGSVTHCPDLRRREQPLWDSSMRSRTAPPSTRATCTLATPALGSQVPSFITA